MKTMKKQRKGFTLTELAIVIAVIAILIAVLVPTFVSLINKANVSTDEQLVKNLNTILTIDGVQDSIDTPADALDAVEEEGYSVEKMTPRSSGEIVYDQITATFALVSDGEVIYPSGSTIDPTAATTWYFADSQSDIKANATVSYIVSGNWSSTAKLTYSGVGGLDTSRAEGLALVEATYTGEGNTASALANNYATASYKVKTATSSNSDSIILNVSVNYFKYVSNNNAVTVQNYGASDTTALVGKVDFKENNVSPIYDVSEIEDNYGIDAKNEKVAESTFNVKDKNTDITTVLSFSTGKTVDTSEILVISTKIEATITDGTISIKVNDVEITNTTSNVTTVTLQLGTEKYPYLLSTADDVVAISNMYSTSQKVYYKLNADVDMANVTGASYQGTLKYECEIDLSGYTIKAAANKQVFAASTSCDAVIKDSSSASTGAICAEDITATQLISFTADGAKLTLESGSIYAKNSTLNYIVYLSGYYSNTQFIMNGGSIYSENSTISSGLVQVGGTKTSRENISFIMNGGTITSDDALSAIEVYSKQSSVTHTIIINDGTIKASDYCIAGSGEDLGSSTITINGGTISSTTDYAIYNPQKGTVTISGGTISGGAGAVCMNQGTLNISGGELICTGEGNTGDASDGTGNLENAVINLGAQYAAVTCTITNCTLTAKTSKTYVITIGCEKGAVKEVTLSVSGVTVSKNGETIAEGYIEIADGFTTSTNDSGATVYSVSAS